MSKTGVLYSIKPWLQGMSKTGVLYSHKPWLQGMPKTGLLYSIKPWLQGMPKTCVYFIATNRGYRVCQKQVYFISHKPWLQGMSKTGVFYSRKLEAWNSRLWLQILQHNNFQLIFIYVTRVCSLVKLLHIRTFSAHKAVKYDKFFTEEMYTALKMIFK